MPFHLAVVRPFQDHAKGDRITEPDAIAAVLASPHEADVVRVHIPKEG